MNKAYAAIIYLLFACREVECFNLGNITPAATTRGRVQMSNDDSVFNVFRNYFSTLKRRIADKATIENSDLIPYSPTAEVKVFDSETNDIRIIPAIDVDAHVEIVTRGLTKDSDLGNDLVQTQEILSVDFISDVVCAAKVRYQIGQIRCTSLLSILKSNSDNEGWRIVSDVMVRADISNMPRGALFTPGGSVALTGTGRLDEEDLSGIIRAAQSYIDGNHGSDVALMKSCMHPSTHLFSVDPTTGKISSRSCQEYFEMMTTRAPSFAPEVIQYDRIFKVRSLSLAAGHLLIALHLAHHTQ
jgi:Putative lumazine-binding